MGRYSKLAVLLTAVLALAGLIAYQELRPPGRPQATTGLFSLEKERANIKTFFVRGGTKAALDYFERAYGAKDEDTKHVLEHTLGEELYAREGLKGLAFCPSSLFSGCYHGFFGAALETEGLGFLPHAEAACFAKADFFAKSGCIHGVGHGLLTNRGHDNLPLALGDCDSIRYSMPFGNEMCYTGVFMEYNLVAIHSRGEKAIVPRPFNASNPYDPCANVAPKYQSACFLQLPQWWASVTNRDFPAMRNLCGALPEGANRDSCFRSIGMVAAREGGYQRASIEKGCAEMPTFDDALSCTEEAAKLLLILGKPEPLAVCDSLANPLAKICKERAASFLCEEMQRCDVLKGITQ